MKKINGNDIIRMVYESYKRIVKENEEQPQQLNSGRPVDFYPKFSNGQLFFNIKIDDKSLFDRLKDFPTKMAKYLSRNLVQNVSKQEKETVENKLKRKFSVATNNKCVNNDTEVMYLGVRINHPETMFTEDGKLNPTSDMKSIYLVLKALQSMSVPIDQGEFTNALKTTYYYANNLINKEQKQQIEDETQKLFFKICQTLGEDKTRELLRTIQITESGYIADHQFAFGNKLRIIAQATIYDQKGGNQVNTISYLATPRQWRKMGRRVVDFTYPYHTVTFNGGRSGQDKEIEFAKQKGLAPILNENSRNGVGFNAGKGLNAAVNAEMYGSKSFSYNDAMYDIQVTEVIQGFEDKWTTEPGMKNNITGELNDVAMQKMNQLNLDDEERNERTQGLNNAFGTTNYDDVGITYQATCSAFGEKNTLPNDADNNIKIRATGKILDTVIINELSGFKKGQGHIALPNNYRPLVAAGRIIIQAIIGIPMDDAPAMQWAEEHKQMMSSLSNIVNKISNIILNKKKEIVQSQGGGLNEVIEMYSPMLVFEETFNKYLNIIKENAEK